LTILNQRSLRIFMSLSTSTLIFVRHGETAANAVGRIDHDHEGLPLNERGQRQAQAVADRLAREIKSGGTAVAAVYVSDQLRARQTAERIAAQTGLPLRIHAGLRELVIGTTPEMSAEEMMRLWHDYTERTHTDPDYALPGGESPRQLTERVARALREIIRELDGQSAIIVSHQGALSTGIPFLLDDLANWRRYQMANCGVTRVAAGNPARLLSLNETEHLAEIGAEIWKPEPARAV
jgi:2,3-bisphosphoglycerate-dependent phosphoglycerate mutase